MQPQVEFSVRFPQPLVIIPQLIVDRQVRQMHLGLHAQIGNLIPAFISEIKSVLRVSILLRIFLHVS